MSAPKWTVGQEVILRERRHRSMQDSAATIARVARKYVYIEQYGRERAFQIEDGVEKGEHHYGGRLFTAESVAEHDRHKAAEARVLGAIRSYSWTHHLSAEVLEQIADLIEAGSPR